MCRGPLSYQSSGGKNRRDWPVQMLRTWSTFTSSSHQNCSSNLDSSSCFCRLEEPTVLQVVLDDDIGDGVENKLHVLGVGGTGEVRINLLGFLLLVQILKLGADVLGGLVVVVGTCVLGKADGQGTVCDLLLKQILLVKKQDDGGLREPFVVADAVEELHTLVHSVHLLILSQHEVIRAQIGRAHV